MHTDIWRPLNTHYVVQFCHQPRSPWFSSLVPPILAPDCPRTQKYFSLSQTPTDVISQFLARHNSCCLSSTLSIRTLCSPSTTTPITKVVVTIDARAVEAEIMNMMIICILAACWTEEPPRIAPVIIPGIAIIPRTLRQTEFSYSTLLKFIHVPHLVYRRRESKP